MAVYLVTYDLSSQPTNGVRAPIEKRIMQWGGLRVILSGWIIARMDTSARAIRDDLKAYLDPNDSLLVLTLGPEAAWTSTRLPNDDLADLLRNCVTTQARP